MDAKYFTPALPPYDHPQPQFFKRPPVLESLVKDWFEAPTIVAFGAVFQLLVCLLLPLRWAVVPSAIVLLNALVTTLLQLLRIKQGEPPKQVVPGRTSTVFPDPDTGFYGPKPTKEPFVVFHIGFQVNHPLGPLHAGMRELRRYGQEIFENVAKNRDEYGLLGMSSWNSSERSTSKPNLQVLYFKDIEGLNRFAADETHRKGMAAFRNWPHIGVYHETFIVQPGGHETLYLNCYPGLLGAARIPAKTGQGEKYLGTLVKANKPVFKTQWSRLHRDENGQLKEDFGALADWQ